MKKSSSNRGGHVRGTTQPKVAIQADKTFNFSSSNEACSGLWMCREEILPKDPATGFKKEGSQPPPKKAKVAVNGQPVKESKPAVNGQATKESKPTGNGQPVKDLADPGKSANPTAPAASLSVKETGERSSPAIKAPTPEPVVKPDLALTGADPAV